MLSFAVLPPKVLLDTKLWHEVRIEAEKHGHQIRKNPASVGSALLSLAGRRQFQPSVPGRSHRARALFGLSSSSAHPRTPTDPTSATSSPIRSPVGKPNIGGDIGPTGPASANLGGSSNPTTTLPVPPAPPTTTSSSTINPDPIVPSTVTQNSGAVGRVPNGHGSSAHGSVFFTSITGGSTLVSFQSSGIQIGGTIPAVSVPLLTTTPGVIRGTQIRNSETNDPTIMSGYSISQTLSTGGFPTPTIASSDPPGQTQTNNAVTQNANEIHHGLPSGGIAGVVTFITICLLVTVILFVRRRKAALSSEHEGMSNEAQDITAEVPPHRYQERAIVALPSHNPPDDDYCYNPTPVARRSSSRLVDGDSHIPLPVLPPVQMVALDSDPRPVPTLVFDTSRYRRNNSRLSLATTMSGNSHHLSEAQGQRFLEKKLVISPLLLAADSSLRRQLSASQDPGSPQSSSSTNTRAPTSPRSPTRGLAVIPPIPPLPKSPPPIPGVHVNPFIDRNPFDDPSG
ncbi:hypothetical protein HYPSUDRAFT_56209 [Hypholoma sublateritium FD-334 SS-4]|uniref:Uncharacterized protein n=1 Tax=Hypholoma sublateritium (strain FD-334 SS-4) TaxID=945553 RepID=A0A0D2NU97_HYPSF|nr:hypothetical protein HYPSUDRAFT_56209 [Hypholoma sublateritium FD-334 SS-4]